MRPSPWSLICGRHDADELRAMGYPACCADAVGGVERRDAIADLAAVLSSQRVTGMRRARLCYDAILVEVEGRQRLHLFSFGCPGGVGVSLIPSTHVLPPDVYAVVDGGPVVPGDVVRGLCAEGCSVVLSMAAKVVRCETEIWALNAAMTPPGPTEYGLVVRAEAGVTAQ
jgi:hypothetical protein